MTKNIIPIIIVVLLVGIAGYFAYSYSSSTPESVPTPTDSQAKININAVCEGAIAYMTFPDGAAADAFIADCKEGKHPEVIEKYKADLNLGAGVAI